MHEVRLWTRAPLRILLILMLLVHGSKCLININSLSLSCCVVEKRSGNTTVMSYKQPPSSEDSLKTLPSLIP